MLKHHSLLQCQQRESSALQSRTLLIAAIVRPNLHREYNHKRRDCDHSLSGCYKTFIFESDEGKEGKTWDRNRLSSTNRKALVFFGSHCLFKTFIFFFSSMAAQGRYKNFWRIAVNRALSGDPKDEMDEDGADKDEADGADGIDRVRRG